MESWYERFPSLAPYVTFFSGVITDNYAQYGGGIYIDDHTPKVNVIDSIEYHNPPEFYGIRDGDDIDDMLMMVKVMVMFMFMVMLMMIMAIVMVMLVLLILVMW